MLNITLKCQYMYRPRRSKWEGDHGELLAICDWQPPWPNLRYIYVHLTIKSDITNELKIDQSVAHNGVCLTVVAINNDEYTVTAIKETLDKTNIGKLHYFFENIWFKQEYWVLIKYASFELSDHHHELNQKKNWY